MTVFEYGKKDSQIILLQPVDEHDLSSIENELTVIRENSEKDFRLIAFRVGDWNRDLSPWNAPPVFGSEGFGSGARETLSEMLSLAGGRERTCYIGGYSLAGLFALWAAYQTDRFAGVAAASPSMWFPGFADYMKTNEIKAGKVYLSLGNREEKTRNSVMATVGDNIREAHTLLTGRGVDCVLEWNEGNHFRDSDIRTAKAFLWVLKERS